MDNELFNLCKETYEATGWESDNLNQWRVSKMSGPWVDTDIDNGPGDFPLYTSDYLLEKLPKKIKHNRMRLEPNLIFVDEHKWWLAQYVDQSYAEYSCVADTPLKALLKLTLALVTAKELLVVEEEK